MTSVTDLLAAAAPPVTVEQAAALARLLTPAGARAHRQDTTRRGDRP